MCRVWSYKILSFVREGYFLFFRLDVMIIIGFGSVALRPFRNLIERKSMSQTLAPKTWTPFVNRESFLSFPDSARTRGEGGKQGRTLKETFEDWTDRYSFSQRAKSIIP